MTGEAIGVEVNCNNMKGKEKVGVLIRVKQTIWCLTLYTTTKIVIRVNR
jgi:hypothetical protein